MQTILDNHDGNNVLRIAEPVNLGFQRFLKAGTLNLFHAMGLNPQMEVDGFNPPTIICCTGQAPHVRESDLRT